MNERFVAVSTVTGSRNVVVFRSWNVISVSRRGGNRWWMQLDGLSNLRKKSRHLITWISDRDVSVTICYCWCKPTERFYKSVRPCSRVHRYKILYQWWLRSTIHHKNRPCRSFEDPQEVESETGAHTSSRRKTPSSSSSSCNYCDVLCGTGYWCSGWCVSSLLSAFHWSCRPSLRHARQRLRVYIWPSCPSPTGLLAYLIRWLDAVS